MCDCRMQQVPISCEFPHEAKNKCMVINEICDAPSLINDLLDKGDDFFHTSSIKSMQCAPHGVENTMGCLSISNLLVAT